MVHLHNGIQHSRKEERAPTLHDIMDGAGGLYDKFNKPGSEKQMLSDLTFKWNLINKTNKPAKYSQRH